MTEPFAPLEPFGPDVPEEALDPEAEHRAAVAEALREHADAVEDQDPDRAKLANMAAVAAANGAEEPFTRGSWGGAVNFTCLFCPDAHLSERSAWIHGMHCRYRPDNRRPGRQSSIS